MSYTIIIGEAAFSSLEREEIEDGLNDIWVTADGVEHEDAPNFPGDYLTGRTNKRSPGYGQWASFLRECGLHELFFGKEHGLMREHPGCFFIAKHNASEVREARLKWEREHPKAVPGWCNCKDCDTILRDKEAKHRDLDGVLARLIWLDYWMHWALAKCKNPVIANS